MRSSRQARDEVTPTRRAPVARRLRLAALRLGLVVLGLAAPLLVLEAALRLAGWGGRAQFDPMFDRETVRLLPDPERTNPWSQGSPGDVLRVAVIGDSFTVPDANEWDDGYAWRLARLLNLNADAPPAAVRVYARGGASTWNELKFLRQALAEGAELVILGVFLNDSEDDKDPNLKSMIGEMLPRVPRGRTRKILQSSLALAWIYQRLELGRCLRGVEAYFRTITDPEYSGWKKFERGLEIFRHRTRTEGVPLLAVVFPDMSLLGPDYHWTEIHRRIDDALERHRIPYLDLLPHFSGKDSVRMAAYPGVDAHPSEIGHRLAARAIFEHLLENEFLDPVYRPNNREKSNRATWQRRMQRRRAVVWSAQPGGKPRRSTVRGQSAGRD